MAKTNIQSFLSFLQSSGGSLPAAFILGHATASNPEVLDLLEQLEARVDGFGGNGYELDEGQIMQGTLFSDMDLVEALCKTYRLTPPAAGSSDATENLNAPEGANPNAAGLIDPAPSGQSAINAGPQAGEDPQTPLESQGREDPQREEEDDDDDYGIEPDCCASLIGEYLRGAETAKVYISQIDFAGDDTVPSVRGLNATLPLDTELSIGINDQLIRIAVDDTAPYEDDLFDDEDCDCADDGDDEPAFEEPAPEGANLDVAGPNSPVTPG